MKAKILLLSFLITLAINVRAQTGLIATVNAMNNDQLWSALLNINLNNETIFAKCKISDATACASCACEFYFRANVVGSLGMYGWPKNPASGDSTGCDNGTQWGGYTPAMATSDVKANARAMLLDALDHNACGTATPVVTTDSLNVTETVKYKFVDPSLTGGIVKCGTTNLGPQVAGSPQFTKLSPEFCLTAYYMALKAQANNSGTVTLITDAQYNNYTQTSAVINTVASTVGQQNQSYTLLDLSNQSSTNPINLQALIDNNVAINPTLSDTQKYSLTWALGTLRLSPSTITYLPTTTSNSSSSTAQLRTSSTSSSTLTIQERNLLSTELTQLETKTVSSKNITSLDQSLLSIAPQ